MHKSFGKQTVLDGINLDVRKGESMVIIGGSGSGKSVMLKSILGLIPADSGSIKIDGQEMVGLPDAEQQKLRAKFGMLFQGGALFDSLPVWQNIAFAMLQQKLMGRAEAIDLAVQKLRAVGLKDDVAFKFPAELSGGMQKRVALARAIATNPDIIFFDEPTTGLDPIMADVINDLIVACTESLGATTVTITHDMHSARKIADRVAMIYEGRIIWDGAIDHLDHSDNPYVDQFIHGSAQGPIVVGV